MALGLRTPRRYSPGFIGPAVEVHVIIVLDPKLHRFVTSTPINVTLSFAMKPWPYIVS
jgi:hypothetical protein